jgi:hypothetical protein
MTEGIDAEVPRAKSGKVCWLADAADRPNALNVAT